MKRILLLLVIGLCYIMKAQEFPQGILTIEDPIVYIGEVFAPDLDNLLITVNYKNTGDSTLAITAITPSANLEIINSNTLPQALITGEESTFTVKITANNLGDFEEKIVIYNNGLEPESEMLITGKIITQPN